jgi:predicted metal-dependent HD superfamily phosphohydrolase
MAAILRMAEEFARQNIGSLSPNYAYHCLEHTKQVVENARIIADGVRLSYPDALSEYDEFLMLVAAWFHDIGFMVVYHGHEAEGCRAARKLLTGILSDEDIQRIEHVIMSTQIPQSAMDMVEHIVCDADLFYLGGNQFSLWSNRLRDEHRAVLGREYTDREWIDFNIGFVESHTYFTEFAKARNDAGRDENLRKLEAMKDALPAKD